jgi:hypothetical protein
MFSLFRKKLDAVQLQESSSSFDMENLEPFLQRVMKLIPQGFTLREVSQVIEMAKTMAHEEEKEIEFKIQFAGQPSIFKVRIFMDDVDTADTYFFSPSGLATRIDAEMEQFFEELGI